MCHQFASKKGVEIIEIHVTCRGAVSGEEEQQKEIVYCIFCVPFSLPCVMHLPKQVCKYVCTLVPPPILLLETMRPFIFQLLAIIGILQSQVATSDCLIYATRQTKTINSQGKRPKNIEMGRTQPMAMKSHKKFDFDAKHCYYTKCVQFPSSTSLFLEKVKQEKNSDEAKKCQY